MKNNKLLSICYLSYDIDCLNELAVRKNAHSHTPKLAVKSFIQRLPQGEHHFTN